MPFRGASTSFEYDSSTDFGTGQSERYSDKTNVTFDDLKAHDGTASNPLTPPIAGMANASISSGTLLVTGSCNRLHGPWLGLR